MSLIYRIARYDRVLHTVRDVIAQHFVLDPSQSGARRSDLGDDIDTVPILLDHARETPHLTFDAAQAFQTG